MYMDYVYKSGRITAEALDYIQRANNGGDVKLHIGSLCFMLHPLDIATLVYVFGLDIQA